MLVHTYRAEKTGIILETRVVQAREIPSRTASIENSSDPNLYFQPQHEPLAFFLTPFTIPRLSSITPGKAITDTFSATLRTYHDLPSNPQTFDLSLVLPPRPLQQIHSIPRPIIPGLVRPELQPHLPTSDQTPRSANFSLNVSGELKFSA